MSGARRAEFSCGSGKVFTSRLISIVLKQRISEDMARKPYNIQFNAPSWSPTVKEAVDFSQFDQERIAVILRRGMDNTLFRGVARFQRDDKLGNILRISSEGEEPGSPDLILTEKSWTGRIIPDFEHGCQFCFIPASRKRSS